MGNHSGGSHGGIFCAGKSGEMKVARDKAGPEALGRAGVAADGRAFDAATT
ncbi:hypothetical protein [Thiolapillus sp.]|uniref:hypothetical protein n=1 Tax=Thiolapillus sp. TaxID=2017437 RepID=UPI003AF85F43